MGEVETPQGPVCAGEHGVDLLAHRKPPGGMGDPGDRAVFNPDHGHHAAPDIDKGAKTGQVGHRSGKHGARGAGQKSFQGQFLGPPAGKQEGALHLGDHAGDGLSHPGEDGNLPGGALPDTQGGLFPGDGSGKRAQLHHQIVGRGAEGHPSLHDSFSGHGLAEAGQGFHVGPVLEGVQKAPFRRI